MAKYQQTKDHLTFNEWMSHVDAHLLDTIGLTSGDLADVAYRDNYDAGMTARDMAEEVLTNEADGMGVSLDFLF